MEKTVNNVEQFVKIKRIANVAEDGVIKRPVFDYDSGAVRGFAIRKAVE